VTEPTYEPQSPAAIAAQVKMVQGAAKAMVALHKRDGKVPEGYDETDMKALTALADQDVMSAKTAAMGTMAGLVAPEALYLMYAKARNALHMLGNIALMRLADKMDDRRAPGSEKVLIKMVEWAGLPSPNEAPVGDAERFDQMQQAEVGQMSDADLQKNLMDRLRKE
jgi:hypothetical protein